MKVRHKLTGQVLTVRNRPSENISVCYIEPRQQIYYTRLDEYRDKVVICRNENIEPIEGQQMLMF